MNSTAVSTVIAIDDTAAKKHIMDRIYVFDSVIFGQKRPGDRIKTINNKNFQIYGIIRKDTAEFGEGEKYKLYDNIWQNEDTFSSHPFFLTNRKEVIRHAIEACLQYQSRMEKSDLLPF